MMSIPQTLECQLNSFHLMPNLVLQRSTRMQMNVRWKPLLSALLGRPYHSSLLATLTTNTEFLLQYPLSIQEILCRHICLIQAAGQGCVADSAQVGVNLDHDKFSYINHIHW